MKWRVKREREEGRRKGGMKGEEGRAVNGWGWGAGKGQIRGCGENVRVLEVDGQVRCGEVVCMSVSDLRLRFMMSFRYLGKVFAAQYNIASCSCLRDRLSFMEEKDLPREPGESRSRILRVGAIQTA